MKSLLQKLLDAKADVNAQRGISVGKGDSMDGELVDLL
jgi:hypothetical protein